MPARLGHALPPLGRERLAGGEGVHREHEARGLELAPQRIELGQGGIATVPEARTYGRGFEAERRDTLQLGDRGLHALERQHGARKEPPRVRGTVVEDPVVVGVGEGGRSLGASHQRQAHEPRREEHHLIGAERVHVVETRVRIATAEQAAELLLPGRGARRELADFLLVPARPANLRGVRAFPSGRDHPSVDVEKVAVGVEAELRLDPASALRRNVFVPDRRRLDDVAVAVEHRKVLADGRGHDASPALSPLEKVVYCPGSRRRLSMTRPPDRTGLERFSLSGRIALVTGATRGLGFEIARGMAAAGAVVGVNGRDAERAREIAKDVPNAFAVPFDITDLEAASAAIDEIVASYG